MTSTNTILSLTQHSYYIVRSASRVCLLPVDLRGIKRTIPPAIVYRAVNFFIPDPILVILTLCLKNRVKNIDLMATCPVDGVSVQIIAAALDICIFQKCLDRVNV